MSTQQEEGDNSKRGIGVLTRGFIVIDRKRNPEVFKWLEENPDKYLTLGVPRREDFIQGFTSEQRRNLIIEPFNYRKEEEQQKRQQALKSSKITIISCKTCKKQTTSDIAYNTFFCSKSCSNNKSRRD